MKLLLFLCVVSLHHVFGTSKNPKPGNSPVGRPPTRKPTKKAKCTTRKVHFSPKKPEFKLTGCGSRMMKIGIKSLTELDAAGSEIDKSKIVDYQGTWTTAGGKNVDGRSITNNLDASVTVNSKTVQLKLNVTLALTTQVINNRTRSKGAMEWNISITVWPFKNSTHKLRVCTLLFIAGGHSRNKLPDKTSKKGEQKQEGGRKYRKYRWSDFELSNSEDYTCNSVVSSTLVETSLGTQAGSVNSRILCYDFGFCNGTIRYDPEIYDDEDASSGSSKFFLMFMFLALILSFLIS